MGAAWSTGIYTIILKNTATDQIGTVPHSGGANKSDLLRASVYLLT